MSPAKQYLITIFVQIVIAGSLLWASGLTWGSEQGDLASGEFTGTDLDSFIVAVWAVSFSVVLAVLALKHWGRRVVGLLGAVTAAGGIYSLVSLDKNGVNSLWVFALILCAALVVTNSLIALTSRNWPTLGSKYSRATPPEPDAWALLDAGVDPTIESDPQQPRSHD